LADFTAFACCLDVYVDVLSV